MADCNRTVFKDTVTRITSAWLNQVDKLMIAIGCAETKAQAQAALEVVPRPEYQEQINLLQSQINTLTARIEALESCNDGYCRKVVAALPAQPDPNTIYFVTG
jgi:hypothetical protein